MKNKYTTYVWACDFNRHTGEGKLARLFINNHTKKFTNEKIIIETPDGIYNYSKFGNKTKKIKKKINFSFTYKYLNPFFGLFKICFNNYFYNNKTIYLNFLPIWNTVLILLLPKKTIIGPITGSDMYNRNTFKGYIRFFVMPVFIFFSKIILKFKYKKIYFSTNLINYENNNSQVLFQLQYLFTLKKRKKIKKDIDLIFYYRKHNNKHLKQEIYFIKILILLGYNVKVCGDRPSEIIENYIGFLSDTKLRNMLDRCKFILSSHENPFSFFVLDAINSNVNILFHKQHQKYIKDVFINYNLIDLKKTSNYHNLLNKYNRTKPTKLKNKLSKNVFNS